MSAIRGKQDDQHLKLTHDRKVSPTGWWQPSRKRWVPTMPNSFGLPSGRSCPGKTRFCVSCYALNTEGMQGVQALVDHNLRLLEEAGTARAMTGLLMEMVGRYVDFADRRRLAPEDRLFRIHWDGDFFSVDYAVAWWATMLAFPDVKFWAYTRSFIPPVDVVPLLSTVPNLALYLSADRENIVWARAQVQRHPSVLLALCDVDYKSAREMAPDRRAIVCPENAGRMELMSDGRGACVECRLCPDARRDVIFSTSHKEDVRFVPVTIGQRGRALTSPQVVQPTAPRRPGDVGWECALPGCGTMIYPTGKRGRPAKFCSTQHRWQASRLAVPA